MTPTQIGSVCEVPSSPGTVITTNGPGTIAVRANPWNPFAAIGPNPQKVVISQPTSGPSLSRNSSRFSSWHRPDPEGAVASIRTEGDIGSDTIQR